MVILALIPALVLGGILLYVLKAQSKDRDSYLQAINLSISSGVKDREASLRTINELTEKIQHPEQPHPFAPPVQGPAIEPPEPPEEFALAGQILPDPEIDDG